MGAQAPETPRFPGLPAPRGPALAPSPARGSRPGATPGPPPGSDKVPNACLSWKWLSGGPPGRSPCLGVPPGAPGPGLSGPRETRGPRGAGAPRPNAGKCRGAGCHHLAPPSALAERASNPTRPCACCQQCNLTPWRRMSPATEQPSTPAKKGAAATHGKK